MRRGSSALVLSVLALSCRNEPIVVLELSSATCVMQQAQGLHVQVRAENFSAEERFDVRGQSAPHRFVIVRQKGAAEAVELQARYRAPDDSVLAAATITVPLPDQGEDCFALFVPPMSGAEPLRLLPCGVMPWSSAPDRCEASDGGPSQDGGPGQDGGPLSDGGPVPDLGPGADAGEDPDAGPRVDLGLPCASPEGSFTRVPITLSTGAYEVPSGYAVSLRFDHRSLVAAGASLASGDDIQVVAPSGARLHRVVEQEPGQGWNEAQTTLWFALAETVAPNSASSSYGLLFGTQAAPQVLGNPSQVFTAHKYWAEEDGNVSTISQCAGSGCLTDNNEPPGGAHTSDRSIYFSIAANSPPGANLYLGASVPDAVGYHASFFIWMETFQPQMGLQPTDRAITVLRFGSNSAAWRAQLELNVGGQFVVEPGAAPIREFEYGLWRRIQVSVHPASGTLRATVHDRTVDVSGLTPEAGALLDRVELGQLMTTASGLAYYLDDFVVRPWVAEEPQLSLMCAGM